MGYSKRNPGYTGYWAGMFLIDSGLSAGPALALLLKKQVKTRIKISGLLFSFMLSNAVYKIILSAIRLSIF